MVYKEKTFFKNLLSKSSIIASLKLEGKYLERFYELLECEYLVKNTPGYVNSRYENINSSFLKLLIVTLGAFLSILQWPFYNHKVRYKTTRFNKLVFVPFAGYIIRYRDVFSITDRAISVVYPPIFHYNKLNNHIKHFNQIKKPITIGCFNFIDLVIVFFTVLFHIYDLTMLEKRINHHYNLSEHKIIVLIFQFFIYSRYFKRLLKRTDDNARIWFFDYDLDAKYISFNYQLHTQKSLDKSVHMQHGIFHEADMAYSNVIADFDFCCSNREKRIIEGGNNLYSSHILVQGCPLQSLHVLSQKSDKKYKLLMLLSSTDIDEICKLQFFLLKFFNYMKENVIIRYRPASRHIDEKVLKEYTVGYNVSKDTTLEEDVKSANCVISFSEDSVFSCFRNSTKLILFISDRMYDIYKAINGNSPNMMVCSTSHCDENLLRKIVDTEEHCDYLHDDVVIDNFGVFTIAAYREQFEKNLKTIEYASC